MAEAVSWLDAFLVSLKAIATILCLWLAGIILGICPRKNPIVQEYSNRAFSLVVMNLAVPMAIVVSLMSVPSSAYLWEIPLAGLIFLSLSYGIAYIIIWIGDRFNFFAVCTPSAVGMILVVCSWEAATFALALVAPLCEDRCKLVARSASENEAFCSPADHGRFRVESFSTTHTQCVQLCEREFTGMIVLFFSPWRFAYPLTKFLYVRELTRRSRVTSHRVHEGLPNRVPLFLPREINVLESLPRHTWNRFKTKSSRKQKKNSFMQTEAASGGGALRRSEQTRDLWGSFAETDEFPTYSSGQDARRFTETIRSSTAVTSSAAEAAVDGAAIGGRTPAFSEASSRVSLLRLMTDPEAQLRFESEQDATWTEMLQHRNAQAGSSDRQPVNTDFVTSEAVSSHAGRPFTEPLRLQGTTKTYQAQSSRFQALFWKRHKQETKNTACVNGTGQQVPDATKNEGFATISRDTVEPAQPFVNFRQTEELGLSVKDGQQAPESSSNMSQGLLEAGMGDATLQSEEVKQEARVGSRSSGAAEAASEAQSLSHAERSSTSDDNDMLHRPVPNSTAELKLERTRTCFNVSSSMEVNTGANSQSFHNASREIFALRHFTQALSNVPSKEASEPPPQYVCGCLPKKYGMWCKLPYADKVQAAFPMLRMLFSNATIATIIGLCLLNFTGLVNELFKVNGHLRWLGTVLSMWASLVVPIQGIITGSNLSNLIRYLQNDLPPDQAIRRMPWVIIVSVVACRMILLPMIAVVFLTFVVPLYAPRSAICRTVKDPAMFCLTITMSLVCPPGNAMLVIAGFNPGDLHLFVLPCWLLGILIMLTLSVASQMYLGFYDPSTACRGYT